MSEETK
jgi:hypothetical protein